MTLKIYYYIDIDSTVVLPFNFCCQFFRRIEEVLKCLPKSSKLAQAIALKRKTPILGKERFTLYT